MSNDALGWLLEEDNPSVRYRTLTELLGREPDDPDVLATKRQIPTSAPVQRLFTKMHPNGYWLHNGRGADINYSTSSTHCVLAFLAELGMDRGDARVARAVGRYLNLEPSDYCHHQSCLYAQNLRTFLLLGFGDDPRVRQRVEVLLADERHDGGYLCERISFSARTRSCIRGSTKALSAFAALPQHWASERCLQLVGYFLRRRLLYRMTEPDQLVRDELVQTIFPFGYRANLLEPLYALSVMGYGQRPELGQAWDYLESKRDEQGRYILDWHPPAYFVPGPKGQPNKWVTLYALLALKYRQSAANAAANAKG